MINYKNIPPIEPTDVSFEPDALHQLDDTSKSYGEIVDMMEPIGRDIVKNCDYDQILAIRVIRHLSTNFEDGAMHPAYQGMQHGLKNAFSEERIGE